MIANYHTHTFRCNHATGTEREYIENAIAGGLKILGFADHAPYLLPPNAVHRMRMLREQVDDYFTVLGDLKKEYASDIEIHIGFEAEYFEEQYEEFRNFIMQYPTEYLILGQHFVPDESAKYVGRPFSEPEYLELYADSCIKALDTGDFTYLAHPDIVNFTGDESVYKEQLTKILTAAKKANIPVEFNLAGFELKRWYPGKTCFELIKQTGNSVIMGCDAHHPENCGNAESAKAGLEMLAGLGITPVDTVDIKYLK